MKFIKSKWRPAVLSLFLVTCLLSAMFSLGYKTDSNLRLQEWEISFQLSGASDTMYIYHDGGAKLDTASAISATVLDNPIDIRQDGVFSTAVGFYDTTKYLAYTNGTKPRIVVEYASVVENWVSDSLGTLSTSNKGAYITGQTSIWKSIEDSLRYNGVPEIFTITPPPSSGIIYRVYLGNLTGATSRTFGMSFTNIKQ